MSAVVGAVTSALGEVMSRAESVLTYIIDAIRKIAEKIWDFLQDWVKRLFNLMSKHPWEFTMTAVNLMILFG